MEYHPKGTCPGTNLNWADGHLIHDVCVGFHTLRLSATGPFRPPGSCTVIIIQGHNSSVASWAAVIRLLSQRIRVYSYDRAGFGSSGKPRGWQTSATIALELDTMLRNAKIPGPYILIGHGWGAVLAREFISIRNTDVAGLVLVEPEQERTLEVLDRRPFMMFINQFGNFDHLEATGITRSHRLTPQEWTKWLVEVSQPEFLKRCEKIYDLPRGKKFNVYEESFKHLQTTVLPGNRLQNIFPLPGTPVVIIKGQSGRESRMLWDAVLPRINKSFPGLHGIRQFLLSFDTKDNDLQTQMITLSMNSIFVNAWKSGHEVQLTEPELVVEAVGWVVRQRPSI